MSPNEAQLRAALRGGEGPGLDVDRVIARAARAGRERHARRLRVASVTAVVAAVTGLGVTAGVLANRPTASENSAASSTGPAHGPAASTGRTAAGPANGDASPQLPGPPAPGPLRDAANTPCPTVLPRLDAARATGGNLLAGPVESFKVCGYTTSDGRPLIAADGTPVAAIYTGGYAAQLAASLDAASRTLLPRPCPRSTANARSIAIIGLSRSGTQMAPITSDLQCNMVITNGTAVRYNWTPPAGMADLFASLGAASTPNVGPGGTGRATGSHS